MDSRIQAICDFFVGDYQVRTHGDLRGTITDTNNNCRTIYLAIDQNDDVEIYRHMSDHTVCFTYYNASCETLINRVIRMLGE